MKKFNLKLMAPLILTLILQGCMPDSLTKFKKDPPKKAVVPTEVSPIVDSAGAPVDVSTITFPTTFYYISSTPIPVKALTVGTAASIKASVDGTLADPSKRALILLSCEIDQTGTTRSQTPPPGMLFNTSTCEFTGTPISVYTENNIPANIGLPITYTINLYYKNASGVPTKISTQLKLGSYIKPTNMLYSQNDRLLLKVTLGSGTLSSITSNTDSAIPYVRTGVITSNAGIHGVVKFVDTTSSQIGLVKTIPITVSSVIPFSLNGFVSAVSGANGKILKIDSANSTLYVETLSSNLPFVTGDSIDNAASYLAAAATISSIASDYNFKNSLDSNSIDNDTQYYSKKFSISSITQTYEINSTITDIIPISSESIIADNGVVYSISPALPNIDQNNPDLIFDTATGTISGRFTSTLAATTFTITATNILGSTSTSIILHAIEPPADLSYTTRQLITVNTNTSFNEGELLFQPKQPPLVESITGQIIRKYGADKLSIATTNGQFLEGALIDSGNNYFAPEATVLADPVFYNVALTVSDSSTFTVGGYASSSNVGALGRVVAIDAGTKTLFIQYLNSNATSILFRQGDTIEAAAVYAASLVTIDQVEADNMKLTLDVAPSLTTPPILPGDELTAATALPSVVGNLGGYIHKVSELTKDIYVSDISRSYPFSNYFRIAQQFENDEKGLVSEGTFTAVAHDNFFIAELGSKTEIKPNTSSGNGIIYSISPSLPAGLTLNQSTGSISGTPVISIARTSYTVTGKNLLNETKFVFDLEVRPYFKVLANTDVASFIFHKYGDSRGSRKCRINSNDIVNHAADPASVNNAALDVRCILDAEEQDLYFNKLKLNSWVGSGVCEYVQVYPYSFWQYKTLQSAAVPSGVTVTTGDCPSGSPPTSSDSASYCVGDYTNLNGPNCDEGTFTYNTVVSTDDGLANVPMTCNYAAPVTVTVNCGGTKASCLSGPIRDILTDTQINSGFRSLLYSSHAGLSVISSFSSPIEKGNKTNLRVANGTTKNLCSLTNTDADQLLTNLSLALSTDSPFAAGPNPYYVVNCLDAAKDIKARIRIVVREWNKSFKIKNDIDYDIPGTLINDSAIVFGKSNNDYKDWDDDYNGPAVDYNAGTCALPGVLEEFKFPENKI